MSEVPVSVLVCRGCCCGTETKHPGIDHRTQLTELQSAIEGRGRLWEVDCLGPCESSNVVVVRRGSTRRWFGEMLDVADTDALTAWIRSGAPDTLPARVAARHFDPDPKTQVIVEPAGIDHDGLQHLAATSLVSGRGSWSIGVIGAVAEFVPGSDTEVRANDGRIEAVTADAAMRLTFPKDLQVFAVRGADPSLVFALILAVPRRTPGARETVTEVGLDDDAVRVEDRNATLFDLGLARDSLTFGVRTADTGQIGALRGSVGASWPAAVAALGDRLFDHSPHRILATAAARVEVYGRVPRPDEPSPEGSHTHLLPAELELGRELAVGIRLPPGLVPAATYYPGLEDR